MTKFEILTRIAELKHDRRACHRTTPAYRQYTKMIRELEELLSKL